MTDPTQKDHSAEERRHRVITQCLEDISKILDEDYHGCRSEIYSSVACVWKAAKYTEESLVESLRKEVEELKIKLHKAEGAFEGQRHRALDIQTQCGNIMEYQKQVIEAQRNLVEVCRKVDFYNRESMERVHQCVIALDAIEKAGSPPNPGEPV